MKRSYLLLYSSLILILYSFSFAQSQLRLEGQPQKSTSELVAVRDANGRLCAAIQVRSNMEGLTYDSYNGVVRVDPKPGEDMVYVSPDERVLKVFKSGYEPLQIFLYEAGVNLNPRDVWQIRITGDARTVPVSIIVEPEDAQILLDGTDMGKGPSFKIPTGKHNVKVSHPDFEPQESPITVDEDHTLFRYTLKRRESAIISVTSDPTGADLYLDGNLIGITPYDGMMLSGRYVLEARKNLYLTTRKEINIKAGLTNTESIRLTPNFGFMEITSQPSNAQVFIDNRLVGQTPYTSSAMDRGEYNVRISKDLHYSEEQTLSVQIDQTTRQNFLLKPAYGGISLYSNPDGAEILIDSRQVGVTPYKDPQLPSGTYQLTLRKDLYREITKRITVTDGKLYEETIELPPNFGTVQIKSPVDATVLLDGKPIRSGNTTHRLRTGLHTIEARKTKHNPVKESINVMVGTERTIELNPEARTGKAAVFVTTQGARDARIVIDGKDYGNAPKIVQDLIEGDHVLQLSKSGYLPLRRKITIEYGQEQRFNAEMMTYAGSMQAEKDSWGRMRNWTLLGTAIFAGAAGGFKYMANQRYDDYQSATLTKDADAAQKDVENYDTYTNGALIGAGVMVVWTLYNQIRRSAVKMPGDKVTMGYDPGKQQICVQIRF